MKNNRIHEYDILKCFGIVMVVMGHTLQPGYLYSLLYYVHMPLFFLLSGCTNRNDDYYADGRNIFAFFVKRIKSLYIPFLKYAIPIVLLHNVFFSYGIYTSGYEGWHEWVTQIGRTLLFCIGTTEPLLGQLWFIK